MNENNTSRESPASTLCKSCGLCCTGHLFSWTKLRSIELDSIQSLGLKVFREPQQRGFDQPCPLWEDICTIYDSPKYPRFCQTYKCKLLKQLLDEVTPLPSALKTVRQTKNLIHELDLLMPVSSDPNFRDRLMAYIEGGYVESQVKQKMMELLSIYKTHFGVSDLLPDSG